MGKREIKFRAKRLDDGKWDYGYLFQGNTDKGTPYAFLLKDSRYAVDNKPQNEDKAVLFFSEEVAIIDKETIGQYTGLKDKNGKEIYEGDIMEVTALDFIDKAKNKKNFVVKYENGFICHIINEPNCWMHLKTAYEKVCYSLKVIGNIFDNSDLIKETK